MLSARTRRFLAHNKLALAGLVIAVLLALIFTARTVMQIVYFSDPRHQDQALQAWMTPRYVMKSYDLPRPLVIEILELDPQADRRRKIGAIAADLGLTLDELTARVREAARLHRERVQ